MSDTAPFYVTTPIYYVNGTPHIGHASTTVAADALARWARLCGRDTFFLTGTDEHGQKVLQAAEARGLTPKQHCDEIVEDWKAMMAQLDITYDRFLRTTDPDHIAAVSAVLARLWDEGLIYRDAYEGWYHINDEIFVTDKDVDDGKYPQDELTRITETNYFFKMSAFADPLAEWVGADPTPVQPPHRAREVQGFLARGLGDLCISRPKIRMSWGIELPFDRDYVTYVWFDALLNYLTGVGYTPGSDAHRRYWPATVQLIGKDILTTHAVYWSTLLMAIGEPLEQQLFAHGWWTAVDGAKMGKSKGNAIDVDLLVSAYGVDAFRYYFLAAKDLGADGTFSYEGFHTRYNADLANDLGNLAHRGLSMTRNWLGAQVPAATPTEAEHAIGERAAHAVRTFAASMDRVDLDDAIEAVMDLVRAGNKYVDTHQPWALNKNGDTERLATVLRTVLEIGTIAGVLLQPVLPRKSSELLGKLGLSLPDDPTAPGGLPALAQHLVATAEAGPLPLDLLPTGAEVTVGEGLFPRFRELPASIAALFAEAEPQPNSTNKSQKSKKSKKSKARPEPSGPIAYEDFAKVQLKAGRILEAAPHPDADRLLVLQVDIGEPAPRQIVAGIASKYPPEQLIGRRVVVVANLAPATLRGVESQGMLLAAGAEQVVDLVGVDADPGEVVR